MGNFMHQTYGESLMGKPAEMPVSLPTPELQLEQEALVLAAAEAKLSSRAEALILASQNTEQHPFLKSIIAMRATRAKHPGDFR